LLANIQPAQAKKKKLPWAGSKGKPQGVARGPRSDLREPNSLSQYRPAIGAITRSRRPFPDASTLYHIV
jgi:hypothetical protein